MARRIAPIYVKVATLVVIMAAVGFAQRAPDPAQEGLKALNAGDFTRAVQIFQPLASAQPSADNFNYLAVAEAGGGDTAGAIRDFRNSIRLGNTSASVQYNLGLALMQSQQPADSIAAFQKAIAIDPRYYAAQYALATALMDSGRPLLAIPYLEKARATMPGDSRIWTAMVAAEFQGGEPGRAARTAMDAVQAIPDDPKLAVTLATLCIHNEEVQTARNLLEDAIELLPENVQVQLLLAKASLLAGEPIETLSVLRNMKPLPPGEDESERLALIGESRALTGNLPVAITDITLATRSSPENPRYLAALAWVDQLVGRYRESMDVLNRAKVLDPKNAELSYRIAVAHYFLGEALQAERACDETLQSSPTYAPGYLLRGIIDLDQNHPDSAILNFRKAISLKPEVGLFRRELGIALFRSGNLGEAKQVLNDALKLNPQDAEAYRWRAQILNAQGARPEAIADLHTAIALQPGDSQNYEDLANLYAQAGNMAMAEKARADEQKAKAISKPQNGHGLLETMPRLN